MLFKYGDQHAPLKSTFFDIDNVKNSNNLFIINTRTAHYGLKLLKVSDPKLWNLIPNYIRSTQSVCSFKQYLKKTSDS